MYADVHAGTTPAAIDTCLGVAESMDVQVTLHTDTLNESACVEHTIAAFKGRTIHSYHTEGAGGGHAPDIISVCGEPNVIPSSTNPTRPFTKNTIDEHQIRRFRKALEGPQHRQLRRDTNATGIHFAR